MAKAIRKSALGTGLSKLMEGKKPQAPIKEIDGYILRLENDLLKEQVDTLTEDLKFCREQLSFMQKRMMTTLDMHDQLMEINKIHSAKAYVEACTKARETDWTNKNE